MKFLDIFKKKKEEVPFVRTLVSAFDSRIVDFKYAALTTINSDLLQGFLKAVEKSRDLALNSPFARSWLSLCEKNVIGKSRHYPSMSSQEI